MGNPYTNATPLDQILTALQIWRNIDHADKIEMNRNDVITIIEGVKALRLSLNGPSPITAVDTASAPDSAPPSR